MCFIFCDTIWLVQKNDCPNSKYFWHWCWISVSATEPKSTRLLVQPRLASIKFLLKLFDVWSQSAKSEARKSQFCCHHWIRPRLGLDKMLQRTSVAVIINVSCLDSCLSSSTRELTTSSFVINSKLIVEESSQILLPCTAFYRCFRCWYERISSS